MIILSVSGMLEKKCFFFVCQVCLKRFFCMCQVCLKRFFLCVYKVCLKRFFCVCQVCLKRNVGVFLLVSGMLRKNFFACVRYA